MATRFEVLLEIHSVDGQSVSFKQDGQRFDKPVTVKLCVDQTYLLNVNFRPSNKLVQFSLDEEELSFAEVAPPTAKKDQDISAFSARWSTQAYLATANGKRHNLRLHLELEDEHVVETTVQVKFYSGKKTTASKWGQPMHVLDLSCDANPDQHYCRVRRGSIL